jgi:hypothetical protein
MRTLSGLTALALFLVVDGLGAQEPAPRPLPSMPAQSQPAAPMMVQPGPVQPGPVVQTTQFQSSGRRGILQRWRERRMARRGQ